MASLLLSIFGEHFGSGGVEYVGQRAPRAGFLTFSNHVHCIADYANERPGPNRSITLAPYDHKEHAVEFVRMSPLLMYQYLYK